MPNETPKQTTETLPDPFDTVTEDEQNQGEGEQELSPSNSSGHPFEIDELNRVIRPRGHSSSYPLTYGFAGYQSKGIRAVTSSSQITPDALLVQLVGTSGATTLTSSPCVLKGLGSQILVLEGTDNTNTVALTDGNGVKLAGGASPVLGLHDTLTLIYDSTSALWVEIARSNNT